MGTTLLIFGLITSFTIGFIYWKRAWLQERLIREYLEKIEPHLPFKVEKIDVHAEWHDFKAGRIPTLNVVLNWDGTRIYLNGRLQLYARFLNSDAMQIHHLKPSDVSAEYITEARIDWFKEPVNLSIWVEAPQNLSNLNSFGAELKAKQLTWPSGGLAAHELKISTHWENDAANMNLSTSEISWTESHHENHQANAKQIEIEANSGLQLSPLKPVGNIAGGIKWKTGEFLWDENYLDLPLTELPIQFQSHSDLTEIQAQIGKKSVLKVSAKHEKDWSFHVQTPDLDIPLLLSQTTQIPSTRTLQGLGVKSGTLNLNLDWSLREGDLFHQKAKGSLKLKDLSLRPASGEWALRGFNLDLPFDTSAPQGMISTKIDQIFLKRFEASLPQSNIQFTRKNFDSYEISYDPFPLYFKGLPLQFGSLHGKLGKSGFEWTTQLELKKVPLSALLSGVCSKSPRPLPLNLSAKFDRIFVDNEMIDPEGVITAQIFDGEIKISELAIYDYTSEVPETDFELNWNKIRLDEAGKWLGFGEMDGTFEGYAHDVTFQSWLPTRYVFLAQGKPQHGNDIVFSPEAMKNVVRLFAGEEIDELPNVANWLAFGWPSRVFGGYDVDYAGISVVSADGALLVETLDPPDVVKKERRHFILYGSRFKMPLKSSQYPLIADATAMGNFVRHVFKQLKQISNKKEKSKNETPNEDPPCLAPEF